MDIKVGDKVYSKFFRTKLPGTVLEVNDSIVSVRVPNLHAVYNEKTDEIKKEKFIDILIKKDCISKTPISQREIDEYLNEMREDFTVVFPDEIEQETSMKM